MCKKKIRCTYLTTLKASIGTISIVTRGSGSRSVRCSGWTASDRLSTLCNGPSRCTDKDDGADGGFKRPQTRAQARAHLSDMCENFSDTKHCDIENVSIFRHFQRSITDKSEWIPVKKLPNISTCWNYVTMRRARQNVFYSVFLGLISFRTPDICDKFE